MSAQSWPLQALEQGLLKCWTLLEGAQVQNTEPRNVLHLHAEIFPVVKTSFCKSSFEEFQLLLIEMTKQIWDLLRLPISTVAYVSIKSKITTFFSLYIFLIEWYIYMLILLRSTLFIYRKLLQDCCTFFHFWNVITFNCLILFGLQS